MSKTPAKGIQSGEDRALQAMKQRQERRAQSQHDTIPEFVEEEGTSPVDLLERGEDRHQDELRVIQDRYDRDPAFRALWNLMRRQRRESNRTIGKVADAALEAQPNAKMTEQIQDLMHWKNRVDTTLSIVKWVAGFVLAATLGSIIVIATKIYTWGVSSGELEVRLQHLEKAMDRRRTDPTYSFPSPAAK